MAWATGIAIASSGCAGPRTSVPTAEALCAAGALPAGIDVEGIRRGRVVFVTECGACHRLYRPGEYSPQEWGAIVKRMADRSSLGTDQTGDLESYLTAASRAARQRR